MNPYKYYIFGTKQNHDLIEESFTSQHDLEQYLNKNNWISFTVIYGKQLRPKKTYTFQSFTDNKE